MDIEKIKSEFIRDIELIIEEKRKKIEQLTGMEQIVEKYHHLEGYDDFAELLNLKINEIIENHGEDFQNDEEFAEFNKFIRPTFDDFYIKYAELGKD